MKGQNRSWQMGLVSGRSASMNYSLSWRISHAMLSLLAYVALALLWLAAVPVEAQSAYFSGTTTTLAGGFALPASIAVDSSGDIFVADSAHSAVEELCAVGGYTTVQTLGSGFKSPAGVAVDRMGNVFVGDTGNNSVKEILAAGGYQTVIALAGGFSQPLRVALDATGDVFVADSGNNAVKEILASSGYAMVNTLGSGFNQPAGVAVDGSGNVYVADWGNSAVKEILAAGSYTAVDTLASGFNKPDGVTVDGSGNVYVADTHNNQVKKILAVDGSIPGSPIVETLGSGFSLPDGVTLDGSGNLLIADRNNNVVKEIVTGGVNFGSAALAGTPPTLTLQFTFTSAGSIEAPTVLTQGASNADFIDAATGTCTTNGTTYVYSVGDTCTVDVAFSPRFSGARYGAVRLLSSSGAMIVTGHVYGTGLGPQVIFSPGVQTALGSNIGAAGVAVDGSGNVFVADNRGNTVSEILAAGGYTTVNSLGNSFDAPSAVALDGSGNVFVADTGNDAVKEIVAAGGYTTVHPLGSGFHAPSGVAVDGSGNVFVADTGNNAVKEILAVSGTVPSLPTIVTLGSGFQAPGGVAVDNSGDVFVADTGNNAVKEIVEVNGSIPGAPAINTLGSGFEQPQAVALDGNQNLFVADTGNNAVKEILASSGYATVNTLGSTFEAPSGVAVDGSGDVYVANWGKNQVVKLDYADPPNLTFAPTAVGSTSSDSPQFVTITNYGNGSLSFAPPATGNNPAISTNFALGDTSTCPQLTTTSGTTTLAPGASCTDLISFAPTTDGPISGSLITWDNNLNLIGTTQTISLSGVGNTITVAPPVLASAQVSVPYGSTALTASGGAAPYIYTVTAGTTPPGLVLSTSGTLSGVPTGAGTYTFTVTATDSGSLTGIQRYSITVAPPVIKLTPAILASGKVNSAYNQTFSASGGTAPYSYQITGGSLPAGLTLSSDGLLSGTPTDAGTFSVSVTATDSTTGTGAPFSVTNSYAFAVKGPAITLMPAVLPAAQVGLTYPAASIIATGGTAPYTYVVSKGVIPPGLVLNGAGVFSGTPTAAGSYSFTVSATDAEDFTGSQTYSMTVAAAITITPATLPPGQAGVAYSPELLVASGGAAPYVYKVTAGTLPAGLILTSSGLLSGTPATAGSSTFTIQATDANGFSGFQAYTITVTAPPITIVPATLAPAQVNSAYRQGLSASGGTPPYTYSETGALPTGITFDSRTAMLSGIPTVAGSFPISVTATDSSTGHSATTVAYNLNVNPGTATLTFAAIPPQTYGNPPFTVSAASGSSGAIAYSVASGPATINSASGTVNLIGAGTLILEASQAPTSSYSSATAQTIITVARQTSITAVSASSTSITPTQGVTLTATVAPYVLGTPGGTVNFFDGTTQLGAAVTLSKGTAQLVNPNLASGQHEITAVYSGDSNFLESSATVATPVTVGSLDFSFTATGTTSQFLPAGGSAAFRFALAPSYGVYPGAVTFSVSGLPPGTTYSTSMTSVPSTAGPQSVTLTIQSASSTAYNLSPNSGRRCAPFVLALLLPLAGVRRLRRSTRRFMRAISLGLLLAAGGLAIAQLSGCGVNIKNPAKPYSVTVAATSGGVQHSVIVTLEVE